MTHPIPLSTLALVAFLALAVGSVLVLLALFYRISARRDEARRRAARWRNGEAAAAVLERIRATPLPSGTEQAWLRRYAPRDRADFEAVLAGFQDYLAVVVATREPTALPSEAADSLWHLLLENPETYAALLSGGGRVRRGARREEPNDRPDGTGVGLDLGGGVQARWHEPSGPCAHAPSFRARRGPELAEGAPLPPGRWSPWSSSRSRPGSAHRTALVAVTGRRARGDGGRLGLGRSARGGATGGTRFGGQGGRRQGQCGRTRLGVLVRKQPAPLHIGGTTTPLEPRRATG